jgi:hypothetical protein
MGFTPEEETVVREAIRQGLVSEDATPSYLPTSWCTLLTFVLAPPSLGLSLLLVPLLWVAQHDLTSHRIGRLRQRLRSGNETPTLQPQPERA